MWDDRTDVTAVCGGDSGLTHDDVRLTSITAESTFSLSVAVRVGIEDSIGDTSVFIASRVVWDDLTDINAVCGGDAGLTHDDGRATVPVCGGARKMTATS